MNESETPQAKVSRLLWAMFGALWFWVAFAPNTESGFWGSPAARVAFFVMALFATTAALSPTEQLLERRAKRIGSVALKVVAWTVGLSVVAYLFSLSYPGWVIKAVAAILACGWWWERRQRVAATQAMVRVGARASVFKEQRDDARELYEHVYPEYYRLKYGEEPAGPTNWYDEEYHRS